MSNFDDNDFQGGRNKFRDRENTKYNKLPWIDHDLYTPLEFALDTVEDLLKSNRQSAIFISALSRRLPVKVWSSIPHQIVRFIRDYQVLETIFPNTYILFNPIKNTIEYILKGRKVSQIQFQDSFSISNEQQ